jgi:hypothetical protein
MLMSPEVYREIVWVMPRENSHQNDVAQGDLKSRFVCCFMNIL